MIRNRASGFTLVELLTVIAITAILMTLIVLPLGQSFNLSRAGQGFADAQERGRQLTQRLARDISNAAAVRDNAGVRGQVAVRVPARPPSAGGPGGTVESLLDFAKLDLVLPAEGDPSAIRNGAYINPATGKADPTLRAPKGQIVLPIAPGATLRRYWIGLRQPLNPGGNANQPYNNPYDGLLMERNGQRDNLFVLYAAEVQPYVFSGGQWQVNTDFFDTDTVDGNPLGPIILDDPWFFVIREADTLSPGGADTGDALTRKIRRIQNWKSRATIVTEDSRYDAIFPIYDKNTRTVVYDNLTPRLISLFAFRPSRIGSETARGTDPLGVAQAGTTEDRETGAEVFQTLYGAWSSAIVRGFPSNFGSWAPHPVGAPYLVARPVGGVDPGMMIFGFDPSGGGTDTSAGVELFNISAYQDLVAAGANYPFSAALRPGITIPEARAAFIPFTLDTNAGKIVASFGIDEVGTAAPTIPGTPNIPFVNTGSFVSAVSAPALPGTFADYETINDRFNKLWQDRPEYRNFISRYIDLRVTQGRHDAQAGNSTFGPLHPTFGFGRASIVPESEVVIGPDQNPGPNYGNPVRYVRTSFKPGRNQYRINYGPQNQPRNIAGAVDYGVLGLNPADMVGFDPNTYNGNNLVSAVIQPRFMPGYLELNSDPNEPLPPGNIQVSYRFQFTKANDAFAVDYDTRQLIDVLLTIRNYPQSTVPNPQMVTLQSSAFVRNFVR